MELVAVVAAPSFLKAKQGVRPRLMSEQFLMAEGSGENRSGMVACLQRLYLWVLDKSRKHHI